MYKITQSTVNPTNLELSPDVKNAMQNILAMMIAIIIVTLVTRQRYMIINNGRELILSKQN